MNWEGLGGTGRELGGNWEGLGGTGRDWEGTGIYWEGICGYWFILGVDWNKLGGTGRELVYTGMDWEGLGGGLGLLVYTGRELGGNWEGLGGSLGLLVYTGRDWEGLGGNWEGTGRDWEGVWGYWFILGGTGRDWEGTGMDWERVWGYWFILGGTGIYWDGLGGTGRGLGGNWEGTGRDWEGTGREFGVTGLYWEGTGRDWERVTGRDWEGTGRELGGSLGSLVYTGRDWDGLGGTGRELGQTGRELGQFRSISAPNWSQTGPKLVPNWSQTGPKLGSLLSIRACARRFGLAPFPLRALCALTSLPARSVTMEELGLLGEKAQDEAPPPATPRPLPSLGPEPEDLEDLYSRYKKLQQELEFLEVQEEYIKDEQRNLKKEFLHAQEEVKRIQSIPLVIGQFLEAVDQNTAIVGSTTGSNYYVRILSTIDRELLKPNASVALHKHSNALVDVLPPEADSSIMMLTSDQKPDVVYADIGGMDIQKQEVREAVELPLTHFELYKQIGIDPPRGVLMYGPPGCGKTMLAKAVAHHTTAAFIRVVGSEFVQKYLGEGPRMVRDVFRLAKENAPAIIFIDEIDAIATKRFDAQTGADREVQRILLELLNQMDGFDQNVNVKVIMATNRADTLDPALLRPGRLDRKIEFPLPDRRQKRLIFSTITGKMNLSEEVDLEDYVARPDKISGADINSICQEGGMLAVRENRYR
uniref:AAA+ ATPase domain-containing protein n=1 Tax=Taeniopygia guttata TaxID=59729 RepID=A0A674H685_TAEGU